MIGKSTSPHDGTESRRRCEPARRERERTPGSCKLNPAFCKAGSRRAARPSVRRGVLIPLPGGTEHNETGRRPVNSGGTADITRQLVRPGERAKAVFFYVKEGAISACVRRSEMFPPLDSPSDKIFRRTMHSAAPRTLSPENFPVGVQPAVHAAWLDRSKIAHT